MSGTMVSISAIDSLAHHCIAAMIVRIYGSLATQRISGGQLLITHLSTCKDESGIPNHRKLHLSFLLDFNQEILPTHEK